MTERTGNILTIIACAAAWVGVIATIAAVVFLAMGVI